MYQAQLREHVMDFKILWIDDTREWVDSVKGAIEEHIREHGFLPEINHQEDDSQIDEFIFRSDIDLIVVDYHLDGPNGDQVIKCIREKGNFLEIVFYSQDGPTLLNELGIHVEHVHCAAREDVEDKIKALVEYAKYKYSNLGYMRGSVIAEAIDIENLFETLMVESFGEHGEEFRRRVLDKGIYDFSKKYQYVQSLLKASCSALEKVPNRSDEENAKLVTAKACRDAMKDFTDEIIHKRNTLAHAQKEWDSNGKLRLRSLVKKSQDIDISREWMMDMRSAMAKYRGVLNKIIAEDLLMASAGTS